MTNDKKPLNTVLIGLGMVADTHVHAIARLEGKVCMKGVFARGKEGAQKYAQHAESILGYGCEVYSSLEAIATDVDFVIIATPPDARLALVKLFTEAQVPMLMEKPIERTTAAATEIVDICEAANVPLGVVFQHRARAASMKLQALVESGTLGKLGLVNVAAPLWRAQSYYDEPGRGTYERDGGGVLMTQAIHTLDLMLSLTGNVSEVQAMSRTTAFHQMEAEDFVTAGMTFEGGAIGSLLATTANYPGGNECITLHFDHAVAKLDRGTLDILWRDGQKESFSETSHIVNQGDAMAFKSCWHSGVIANFVDAITLQKPLMASGREALKVHHLIDALLTSSMQKQAIKNPVR